MSPSGGFRTKIPLLRPQAWPHRSPISARKSKMVSGVILGSSSHFISAGSTLCKGARERSQNPPPQRRHGHTPPKGKSMMQTLHKHLMEGLAGCRLPFPGHAEPFASSRRGCSWTERSRGRFRLAAAATRSEGPDAPRQATAKERHHQKAEALRSESPPTHPRTEGASVLPSDADSLLSPLGTPTCAYEGRRRSWRLALL